MMVLDLLAGIRVLDLSQYVPGPYASQILGDLGAAVVKIEPPDGDPMRCLGAVESDGTTAHYKLLNAGKTVVRLDLKDPAAQARLAPLIAQADILVESFRPGTLRRLGFDTERLRALNSSLIHLALSGWGQDGPYRLRAGHDLTYMAVGGGLIGSGVVATPIPAFPPVADHAAAIQAALAVVAALLRRFRHPGRGAYLDVSLMETVLGWQGAALTEAARTTPDQAVGDRGQTLLTGGAAYYRVYRCADGGFLALAAIEAKFWQAFCRGMGRLDWIGRHDEPLPQDALAAEIAATFATAPLSDWDQRFAGVDCCLEPVVETTVLASHPQVAARGQILRQDGLVHSLFGLRVDRGQPPHRAPLQESTIEQVAARWATAP
ncbi:MAG: CoA transferase [Azospirillaceae bacterium]|nr:CoA transferase [Azospirillaceae bacterium]